MRPLAAAFVYTDIIAAGSEPEVSLRWINSSAEQYDLALTRKLRRGRDESGE
ncbi:hypothetical protein [Paenibacillus sp. sgz500958]|uniref:hypothetical protein n=1 Tax=Paenibacillus sp. sgz500958 TaxID=3242475 RepID=UPI0036D27E74